MKPSDLCPGCPWWCEFEAWCREEKTPPTTAAVALSPPPLRPDADRAELS